MVIEISQSLSRKPSTALSNQNIFHPAELDQLNAVQIADAQVIFLLPDESIKG
jgi:hypothetical protein